MFVECKSHCATHHMFSIDNNKCFSSPLSSARTHRQQNLPTHIPLHMTAAIFYINTFAYSIRKGERERETVSKKTDFI